MHHRKENLHRKSFKILNIHGVKSPEWFYRIFISETGGSYFFPNKTRIKKIYILPNESITKRTYGLNHLKYIQTSGEKFCCGSEHLVRVIYTQI